MDKKILILLLATFILIAFGILGWYFWNSKFNPLNKADIQTNLAKKSNLDKVFQKKHPELYFVDLEYNPKNGLVTQIATGKTSGDPQKLLPSPLISSRYFTYKVEIISDKNELISSGWVSSVKEILLTNINSIVFRVITPYIVGSTIRLSLPDNKVIWSGKML